MYDSGHCSVNSRSPFLVFVFFVASAYTCNQHVTTLTEYGYGSHPMEGQSISAYLQHAGLENATHDGPLYRSAERPEPLHFATSDPVA